MLRRRWPIAVFVAWSAFVWVTRINNARTATDESATATTISILTAVVLLIGAAAAVVALVRARGRGFDAVERSALRAFAGLTVVAWVIRVPVIVLADHEVPFKVVHTVLAVISVVLAVVTWRLADDTDRDLPTADAGAARRGSVAGSPAEGNATVSPGSNAGR